MTTKRSESWVTKGLVRAEVAPERMAACRAIKSLMAEQGVRYADLAPITRRDERHPNGVSQEFMLQLLDERRTDSEIQLRDVAVWSRVLGVQVVEAFLRAYRLPWDVVPLVESDGQEKAALRATGVALRAAGELAAEVDQALEDGLVTHEEAAKVAKRAEAVVRSARGAGGAVAAMTPKRALGGR